LESYPNFLLGVYKPASAPAFGLAYDLGLLAALEIFVIGVFDLIKASARSGLYLPGPTS